MKLLLVLLRGIKTLWIMDQLAYFGVVTLVLLLNESNWWLLLLAFLIGSYLQKRHFFPKES